MARGPRSPEPATPASEPTPEPAPARRRSGLGPARHGGVGKVFTSQPVNIAFAGPEHRLSHAELQIDGIYHGEASYEGRVFLDNPTADGGTERTAENGYAGSFHIFGHGGCLGDAGHCEVHGHREAYDFRNPHPLTPARKQVDVTAALQRLAKSKTEATITVVPVITAANELTDRENVFRFGSMRFVSYDP